MNSFVAHKSYPEFKILIGNHPSVNEFQFQIGKASQIGKMGLFQLILHGTKNQPMYRANGPRKYDEEYNRIHRKVRV